MDVKRLCTQKMDVAKFERMLAKREMTIKTL